MLRNMAWLTPQRARLYVSAMAITLALTFMIEIRFLYSHGGYDLDGNVIGADFSSFWAASWQILAGKAAEVYVPKLHYLAEFPVLRGNYEAFFYPPTFLVLCVPLALAPFFVSYALFMATTAFMLATAVWKSSKSIWLVVALVAYPAAYTNIVAGQNAFLTAAIFGYGLLLIDRRPRLAGAILGLMVIKPHLALAVPIALIVTRRWRTFAWAALSAVSLATLSYLLFGLETWVGFLDNSHMAREVLDRGEVDLRIMQSVFAVARISGASATTGYALQGGVDIVVVCALVWALPKCIGTALERSLIVIACLLITPFSLHYDMVLGVLPIIWMTSHWRCKGFPKWSKLILGLAFLSPMIDYISFIYYVPFLHPVPFGFPVLLMFGILLLREVARNTNGEPVPTGGPRVAEQPRAKEGPALAGRFFGGRHGLAGPGRQA